MDTTIRILPTRNYCKLFVRDLSSLKNEIHIAQNWDIEFSLWTNRCWTKQSKNMGYERQQLLTCNNLQIMTSMTDFRGKHVLQRTIKENVWGIEMEQRSFAKMRLPTKTKGFCDGQSTQKPSNFYFRRGDSRLYLDTWKVPYFCISCGGEIRGWNACVSSC